MPAIDRINGTSPVDQAQANRRVQDAGSKEAADFKPLLDDREGVIYEPGKREESEVKTIAQIREDIAREQAAAARANLHSRFDGPGVAVELSTDGAEAASRSDEQQSIGSIFKDAWKAIVGFFLSIWNGGGETAGEAGEARTAGETTENADEVEAAAGSAGADTRPAGTRASASRTARKDDMDEVEAFLADYGGRHLAKNSDLLTQYDRSGHIISVDPSDRRRILQGEGRVRRF